MITALNEFRKTYHLRVARKPSSPVTEFSAGLSLQYAKNLANAPIGDRKPFYISVPDREHFTVLFSCTLLLNFLYEDYFNPPLPSCKAGDRVEIFGSIAQYTGMSRSVTDEPVIRLLFDDSNYTNVSARYSVFLNPVKSTRKLSKSLGSKRAYQFENDLNSLFNLGKDEAVNSRALGSQVYLITGRGKTDLIKECLKTETCLNQTMAEAFGLNTNLIVKPNLEELKASCTKSEFVDNSYFTESLGDDLDELREVYGSDENIKKVIKQLADLLEKEEFIPEFRFLFNRLTESIDDPYRSRLLGLTDYIPSVKAEIPGQLKLVVVDEVSLITDYGNTISRLMAKGIPVIILTDRSELASGQDMPLDSLKNSYRFCWNRNLISKLIEDESAEYCDNRFWQRCKQYVNQKITVRQFEDPAGDSLFSTFEANPAFVRLEGFEKLKKDYFRHLRPAIYLLKNTPGDVADINQLVSDQVALFSKSFETIEHQLPAELADTLRNGLLAVREYTGNPKRAPENVPVFIQRIEFPGGIKKRTGSQVLKNLRIDNLTRFEETSLVFTGFPYRELNGNHLSDSIFRHNIRSVTVLAWPKEAGRIVNYLTGKLNASGFSINLPVWVSNGISGWQLPFQSEKTDDRDLIKLEGYGTELIRAPAGVSSPVTVNFDDIQKQINNFRFSSLFNTTGEAEEYLVPADVIYFHSGSYMLLPQGRNGRVYVAGGQHKSTGDIEMASFSELSVGDLVISFNMSRDLIRDLSREQLISAYEQLDVWHERLKTLLDHHSGHYGRLADRLMAVKQTLGLTVGNPSRYNLMRWLHETDLLAPREANLWIILCASGLSQGDAKAELSRIQRARRLILHNSSLVSDQIIKKILTVLGKNEVKEEDQHLDIDGVSVSVQFGRISDREKRSDLKVPYSLIKRFIKD